ncbi:MAG: HDOD domain-containing protein [Nitrosomonadales bacterium]
MPIETEKAIKKLVAQGIKLPPQPKVLIELDAALSSGNYSMKMLAKVISTDPGITAMLFKIVGSPVFGNKKCESLEQVLMLVGVKQTYNLVQAICLSTNISDSTRKSFEIFWTRSDEIAKLAALIAGERVSVCNIFPDQAYMAGIFHECGVPVLMQRFPEYCGRFNLGTHLCGPSLILEDEHFNVDHCSIGYLIARHWKLPDFICKSILYHYEMPRDEQGVVRTLVAILQLAIHFHHRISHAEHPVWLKIGAEVLEELGISQDAEQAYYEEISEQFLA